jgi:hypothetical protein
VHDPDAHQHQAEQVEFHRSADQSGPRRARRGGLRQAGESDQRETKSGTEQAGNSCHLRFFTIDKADLDWQAPLPVAASAPNPPAAPPQDGL